MSKPAWLSTRPGGIDRVKSAALHSVGAEVELTAEISRMSGIGDLKFLVEGSMDVWAWRLIGTMTRYAAGKHRLWLPSGRFIYLRVRAELRGENADAWVELSLNGGGRKVGQ